MDIYPELSVASLEEAARQDTLEFDSHIEETEQDLRTNLAGLVVKYGNDRIGGEAAQAQTYGFVSELAVGLGIQDGEAEDEFRAGCGYAYHDCVQARRNQKLVRRGSMPQSIGAELDDITKLDPDDPYWERRLADVIRIDTGSMLEEPEDGNDAA